MSTNNRDNFSESIKRAAASRVGYRCSFPGCNNTTIGASMENNIKAAITGQAAHICAAAAGGPRYDKNMTPAERKGIDNCIWLCDVHARLIDTDTTAYPPELLRQWKKEAEANAAAALANRDFFAINYKNNGDNLFIITQLFDDMIADGDFGRLQTMLSQYSTKLSDVYEEFIARYKVIYDIYCSHDALQSDLDNYLSLSYKPGIDSLVELLFSFLMTNELKKTIEYCQQSDLRELAEMAINDTFKDVIFVPIGSCKVYDIPQKYKYIFHKAIDNYIRLLNIPVSKDSYGNDYEPYDDEFFFRLNSAVNKLKRFSSFSQNAFLSMLSSEEYSFICENAYKINYLDITFQEYFWSQILMLLSTDTAEFEKMYNICSHEAKNLTPIKTAQYFCQINQNYKKIDVDKLVHFSDENNAYGPLLHYLVHLEHIEAVNILNDRAYLYKKSSAFLYLRLNDLSDIPLRDSVEFLKQYDNLYNQDFTYQCLLTKALPDSIEKSQRLQWIKDHKKLANSISFPLLINILTDNKEWETLASLSKFCILDECLYMIATGLAQSGDNCFIAISKHLFEDLIHRGWDRQWLRYNLGIVNMHLGFMNNAKKNCQEEYDNYHHIAALKLLMNLRYNTNEYLDDSFLYTLKNNIDFESQSLSASFFFKLNKYSDAWKYFLRALLLDNTNLGCMSGLWQSGQFLPNRCIDKIGADTTCILQGKNITYKIAIHNLEIMDGIDTPSCFAEYVHYSIENPVILNLLFSRADDIVTYNNESCKVLSVTSTEEVFGIYAFQTTLLKSPHSQIIHATNGKEFINAITPILKSSADDLEKSIMEYNASDMRLPLTIFAHALGRDMLTCCEFLLYGNKEKIRNNLSTTNVIPESPIFILGYDAIVELVHLGLEDKLPNEIQIACAPQVKNQLLNDLNEQLSQISSNAHAGTISYQNEAVSYCENTPTTRRTRYNFLTRLRRFINSINVLGDGHDYVPSENLVIELRTALIDLFSTQKLLCESGTLGGAQNVPNCVIVTDDQFLFANANEEKLTNVGLVAFLSYAFNDWEQLLNVSKDLKAINFGNYLPLELYDKMVLSVIEKDNDNGLKGSSMIKSWLKSDTDGDPTQHHENIVLMLAQEVLKAGNKEYLNPDNFLLKLALGILEKRNPGLISNLIRESLTDIGLVIDD